MQKKLPTVGRKAGGGRRQITTSGLSRVVLPDVLIDNLNSNPAQDNLAAMVQRFHENAACQIMVNPVPEEQVSSFGVVDVNGNGLTSGQFARIQALVEKPALADAPSNLAITGRYVLHKNVWKQLHLSNQGSS